MAARGHLRSSFEGRPIQAPGMMRHGPFPGLGPSNHRPLDPRQLLENKIADQAAEMERLVRENQRLASSHVALRQELVGTQHEMQRLHAHRDSVLTESDIQIRGLVEKIAKSEADIRAGEMLKKELQQAHLEAQSLIAARQELAAEIQLVTEELQKTSTEKKNVPEIHSELDMLRQEHQKLRSAFEFEKGSNVEQVERMRAMEKNLMSMAREVEKLRAEVQNAEKRAHGTKPYGHTYSSPDPVYPPAGQGSVYKDRSYGQGGSYLDGDYGHTSGYPAAGFGHGGPASYPEAYGRPQAQMTSGAAGEVMNAYGHVSGPGYSDGYGRPQAPLITGVAATEGTNAYAGASGSGSYDATRGAPAPAQR